MIFFEAKIPCCNKNCHWMVSLIGDRLSDGCGGTLEKWDCFCPKCKYPWFPRKRSSKKEALLAFYSDEFTVIIIFDEVVV